MMKQCRRCEQNLPLSSFRTGKTAPRVCESCLSELIAGAVFTMNATEAVNFMARLEAGEALRTLVGGGGNSICSDKAFRRHCELNPDWGAKALALARANRKSRILEGVYNRTVGNRTACNRGHSLSVEIAAKMHAERKWDHKWCESCVRNWSGVGRYLAEDTPITEPPKIEARPTLSSSLLKNLEMENFHIFAGRFWSGAVELDVISSLVLSVPPRGVAMRRAVLEFGSGYRRSD
ncbi:hypothetical protein IVB27_34475 [Bradyrhizobium sp. 197]|nr:hypothetical protein [Bradyrhizobium sp. 197]